MTAWLLIVAAVCTLLLIAACAIVQIGEEPTLRRLGIGVRDGGGGTTTTTESGQQPQPPASAPASGAKR